MKFLKCALCRLGEIDIVGNDRGINKKIKCRKCGFSLGGSPRNEPEVMIIRKRHDGNA